MKMTAKKILLKIFSNNNFINVYQKIAVSGLDNLETIISYLYDFIVFGRRSDNSHYVDCR